jgi:hypothetical protein
MSVKTIKKIVRPDFLEYAKNHPELVEVSNRYFHLEKGIIAPSMIKMAGKEITVVKLEEKATRHGYEYLGERYGWREEWLLDTEPNELQGDEL